MQSPHTTGIQQESKICTFTAVAASKVASLHVWWETTLNPTLKSES